MLNTLVEKDSPILKNLPKSVQRSCTYNANEEGNNINKLTFHAPKFEKMEYTTIKDFGKD